MASGFMFSGKDHSAHTGDECSLELSYLWQVTGSQVMWIMYPEEPCTRKD